MNRTTQTLLAAAVAAAIPLAAATARDGASVDLKVVGTWSNLNNWRNFEKPFWDERIAEASGGAITATASPVTEFGMNGFEVMRMLRLGVFDVAHGVFSYVASEEPVVEGIDLSGLASDARERRALVGAYLPVLEELFLERYDARILGVYADPMQMLWCNGEVEDPEDLTGLRIRIFSRAHGDMVEGLGATSVTIPFGELPLALQRQTVDCAITGSVGAYLANLGDVTTHAYALDLGQTTYFVAIGDHAWQRLDTEARAVLEREVERLGDEIWRRNEVEAAEALGCLTGASACPMGEPAALALVDAGADGIAARRASLEEFVLPRWAERCGADCAQAWNETVGRVIGAAIE